MFRPLFVELDAKDLEKKRRQRVDGFDRYFLGLVHLLKMVYARR